MQFRLLLEFSEQLHKFVFRFEKEKNDNDCALFLLLGLFLASVLVAFKPDYTKKPGKLFALLFMFLYCWSKLVRLKYWIKTV